MNNYEKCPSCKTPYIDPRAKEIAEASAIEDPSLSPKKAPRSQTTPNSVPARVSTSDDALVEAQNRTTHAVRSLAITFVAAPILFLVVGGFMFFAISTEEPGLILVSLIIGVISFGWILISSLSELSKSYVR
jgi:hypothetical protein